MYPPSPIIQGYRATQQAIVEATEQAAEVDAMKGATLEEISRMVDQISREYRAKQAQLQPLTQELKVGDVRYVLWMSRLILSCASHEWLCRH